MPATRQSTTAAPDAAGTRKPWSRPSVECLESRPEVTAYAGAGDGRLWTTTR